MHIHMKVNLCVQVLLSRTFIDCIFSFFIISFLFVGMNVLHGDEVWKMFRACLSCS